MFIFYFLSISDRPTLTGGRILRHLHHDAAGCRVSSQICPFKIGVSEKRNPKYTKDNNF